MATQQQSVVLDANVLINLLNMNQLHILPNLKQYKFMTPNHVMDEIHRRNQRLKLRKAIKADWFSEIEITDIAEMELYVQYRARFGSGESACMAAAIKRGWIVASDERAVKREVTAKLGVEKILGTQDLLKIAVQMKTIGRSAIQPGPKLLMQSIGISSSKDGQLWGPEKRLAGTDS